MSVEDFIIGDLQDRYKTQGVDGKYLRLYQGDDRLGRMFAILHSHLNSLLGFMNKKNRMNKHYNADESRALLDLIEEIASVGTNLKRAGIQVSLDPSYQSVLDTCSAFLTGSGGSAIPDDFPIISIEEYAPIFHTNEGVVHLKKKDRRHELIMVGSGSYATVYKYRDEEYGFWVALKRARRDLDSKELERFRAEFKLLHELRFPYIVEAYGYDQETNSYTMEYCDLTLAKFLDRNNRRLSFSTRKRIALQFLYGINFLHRKGILHRDISYTNTLIKPYDSGAVLVKLSDFGLHKSLDLDLTTTRSEIKGTIIDPSLSSFKEYSVAHELYAIGYVLNLILTGRKAPDAKNALIYGVVQKCVSINHDERYSSVLELISDVEQLSPAQTDLGTGSPA